jgi:hypothetical protein
MNVAPFPPPGLTFALSRQPRLRAAVSLCESTFSMAARHSAGAGLSDSRMTNLMN